MSKKGKSKSKDYKVEYSKYKDVPEDKEERLQYIFDKLKVNKRDLVEIDNIIKEIKEIKKKTRQLVEMTFYIIPEGISRPRKGKWGFYVPNIRKFYDCMDAYLNRHQELIDLNIFSECKLDVKYFLPIPSDMRKKEKVLAELRFIKPIKKPDWDNLGKGTDMLHRIWLDDALVNDARVRKYYSFKPRIEVRIVYYSQHQNSYHELCIEKMLRK